MKYLVPSRLPLEGTMSYLYLLGCNRWPVVLEVQDLDSSPQACHQVGGWGRSPGRMQISYSYVTIGSGVGFGGEVMG
jgi:hypothetical protein